ncbi:glycoside hydrolase family 16 protein [Mycena crocata]|nr:glycoside hydrolase family 16 protein [Mycena crocata]
MSNSKGQSFGSHSDISEPRRETHAHNLGTNCWIQNVGLLILLCLCTFGLYISFSDVFTNPIRVNNLPVNATSTSPAAPQNATENLSFIDVDTPKDVYNIQSYHDPSSTLQLVFSDEFEKDGRTFYHGDDPYWEAVDLHYWQTQNLEWYDPAAITTHGGALEINLTRVLDPSQNHNMSYMGGMITTWNKFCFTGGLIVTSVMMPGSTNVLGLWPAVWTMGNLGRAGYGASVEGMWPYGYDACDVGTLANQTLNNGPPAALHSGNGGGQISNLPGQRLSRCTCPGESHPGPMHSDNSYVGRAAPEIDLFEAQIGGPDGAHVGQVAQSLQVAPFNAFYRWDNSSDNMYIANLTLSHQNTYSGSVYQQAASVVSTTNQDCYQLATGCYAVQGFEYVPGYDNAYITWISDNKTTWTLNAAGIGADPATGISARPIPEEPMYILANLGISQSFGVVDLEHLTFPATMRIDWVRVYQHPDKINIGCDPPERPTAAYIDAHIDAYTDASLFGYYQAYPKNKLNGGC